MASLVHLGKNGAFNAADTTIMGYYVIKHLSETYTLQEYQTTDGQLSKEGEPVVKTEYLSIIKSKPNWYWQQHRINQSVIRSTRTFLINI